jgi:GH15 family glucan-1,4-alpha-glucosidase
MQAGDVGGAILESGAEREAAAPIEAERVLFRFNETVRFWRGWLGRSTYTGRWRDATSRSAMTLKLMTYAPTGALVAAPTTSLPEQVGGERNWDYRFTWVRDASFSVYALLGLGYTDEALAFLRWLRDRVGERAGQASGPLKIMYRIDGSSDLHEETLDHLEGYRGSAPVHIGNGASDQLQLDIYGEAMNSLYSASRQGGTLGHEAWLDISVMMDWLAEHWDEPEEGIWETRGERKNFFTYGRLMSWVAMDRSIRMARELGRPADVARWTKERDRIYRQIMDRGWNKERGAFVQHYDSSVLDASNLLKLAAVERRARAGCRRGIQCIGVVRHEQDGGTDVFAAQIVDDMDLRNARARTEHLLRGEQQRSHLLVPIRRSPNRVAVDPE